MSKNPSLRERLEKHWDNKNWGAFVSLFMRDKTASNATKWRENFCDGLYMLMTESLFTHRDFDATRAAISLILDEPDGSDKISEIKNCALVALSFLDAREGKNFSLVSTAELPSQYASLNKELRAALFDDDDKREHPLVKKFVKQMQSLEGKSGLTAYTNWLKTADDLEKLADEENLPIFKAVAAIVALIRELSRSERKRGSLSVDKIRDIDYIRRFKAFHHIVRVKDNPVVRGLWEFFCRQGEAKFGEEWAKTARITIDVEKYEHFLKEDDWTKVLRLAAKTPGLSEQETYLLKTLYFRELVNESCSGLVEIIKDLTRIGKRWRANAPWCREIEELFREMMTEVDYITIPEVINIVKDLDAPYESLSPASVAAIAILRGGDVADIEKNLRARIPMTLEPEDIDDIAPVLGEYSRHINNLSLKVILGLEKLFDKKSLELFFIDAVEGITTGGAFMALRGISPRDQTWSLVRQDALEKLRELLPPESPEGCFCRLAAPNFSISKSSELAEAFFGALSGSPLLGQKFFFVLSTWENVEASFVIRLFEHCFTDREDVAHWGEIAEHISNLKNKQRGGLIAHGILLTMRNIKKKSEELRKAISKLEKTLSRKIIFVPPIK